MLLDAISSRLDPNGPALLLVRMCGQGGGTELALLSPPLYVQTTYHAPMAIQLWMAGDGRYDGMVHLDTCPRIHNPAHPANLVPWDGSRNPQACRTCLAPGRPTPLRLPCSICDHPIARPCPHNGVLRVIPRRRRGPQMIYVWPDRVKEADWLRSLLE